MSEKRISELTEVQTFDNNDYIAIDDINKTEAKKIKAKKIGITYTMSDTEDGFEFDGSDGTHYEKVIPKDAQMPYDDYVDLTEEEKMDNSNRFIPDYPEEEKEPEIWTRVGRTPLQTVAKVISNAINELKGRIDGNDDDITEIKSNLTQLIKTKSYNATTTDTGVIAIADLTANNIIPIQVSTSVNNCYHIFGANSSGKLAIRFTDSGGASKVSTAISGTVYYIEI